MLSKHLNFIIIEFCKHLITGILLLSNNDTCLKYRFFICIKNLYSGVRRGFRRSDQPKRQRRVTICFSNNFILDTGADLQCLQ